VPSGKSPSCTPRSNRSRNAVTAACLSRATSRRTVSASSPHASLEAPPGPERPSISRVFSRGRRVFSRAIPHCRASGSVSGPHCLDQNPAILRCALVKSSWSWRSVDRLRLRYPDRENPVNRHPAPSESTRHVRSRWVRLGPVGFLGVRKLSENGLGNLVSDSRIGAGSAGRRTRTGPFCRPGSRAGPIGGPFFSRQAESPIGLSKS
jgi:hypothetical protein